LERRHAEFLQLLWEVEVLLPSLDKSGVVVGPYQVLSDTYIEDSLSTAVPSMWIGASPLPCFLKSTINSFVLLRLRERLLSWHHNESLQCLQKVFTP
jgi:hypothetical protein